MPTPGQISIRQRTRNPRRNLPCVISRKRGESNFLLAFERAYFAKVNRSGIAGKEFAVSGYGIADLVWVAWKSVPSEEDFTAISVEKQLTRRHIFAFEAKLKDWQRALHQAFRYRYFADKAIVVMPAINAAPAIANLESFRRLAVGLWTFDAKNAGIREYFTPTKVSAINRNARGKVISSITSKIDFRKLRKELNPSG